MKLQDFLPHFVCGRGIIYNLSWKDLTYDFKRGLVLFRKDFSSEFIDFFGYSLDVTKSSPLPPLLCEFKPGDICYFYIRCFHCPSAEEIPSNDMEFELDGGNEMIRSRDFILQEDGSFVPYEIT